MLMDIIGITLLAPVAPYIVGKFSNSALMVTMLTILYAAGQFIAAPMLGKLGDRYGRRPVLLLSLFGQGIGYIIFALGGSLWVLFLGRIIGGITGGNLSTAAAYIADVSKPAERAKNFSLIGTAWSLGLILGPAFGGVLGQLHLSAPAYIAAVPYLPECYSGIIHPARIPAQRAPGDIAYAGEGLNPIFAIVDMARRPGLGWLLLVTCLFNFAFNGINTTSSIFFIHKFSAQTWHVSLLMMLAGAAIMATNFLLVPRLVPRFGDRRVAGASLMGQAVVDIAVFFMPIFWPIFILNMLISAISAFTFPTLTTLSIDRIPHREVGLLMGVTTGLASLMNIFGPLWAGAVYDGIMPGAPYWMGAVILIGAGLMLLRPKTAMPVAGSQPETEEN